MSALLHFRPGERPTDWIDEHVDTWVAAGLVSQEQAARILEAEHRDTERRPPTFSVGAEVAVYLGSVLALVAGAMIVARSWEDMALAIRMTVALAIAALGVVTARWLLRIREPGTQRLASFMWLIATGGVALAIATGLDGAGVEDPAAYLLSIGSVVAAIGIALWRNLDRPLQVLTTTVGLALVFGGIAELVTAPTWVAGLVVIGLGLTVMALGVGEILRPELYVVAVGSVTAMIGGSMLTDLQRTTGFATVAAIAALVVGVGLLHRLTPVVVIGVIGFLAGLRGLFETVLRGPLAALSVAVVGLLIVLVVIARATRHAPPDPER